MLVGGQKVGWLAATWREVVVGGSGNRTLVHSGGGQSAPKVVGLGDRWWLGGMLRRLWEEANKVLSFHGKLYLCKERTKLINSVRCPLDEKIGSNQGHLADSWTIFPPKRVCHFFFNQVCCLAMLKLILHLCSYPTLVHTDCFSEYMTTCIN